MIDYWPDNLIDCKDYAIEATIRAQSIGAENIQWILTPKERPNHVIVKFEKNGVVYVASNGQLYRTSNTDSRPSR